MAGNENAAAGERNKDTASRDRDYGGKSNGGKDTGKGGGPGVGGQMHANRQAEIARTAQQTGAGTSQIGNSGRTEAGLVHDTFAGMGRDYRDEGNTMGENAANMVASALGFDERRPTKQAALDRVRGTQDPTQNGVDMRADWGFDVIGALAAFAGLATGMPISTIYKVGKWATGAEVPTVNMGPDVFAADRNRMQSATSTDQGARRPGGQQNSDKGGKRGLLPSQPQVMQQQPKPQPQQPNPQTPPATPPNSKYPNPDQKFQAGSYYMGDWAFDPVTQKPVWQQKPNGLMPSAA